ncbi:MAG: DUF6445 family protein [Pseudomonadota bacterium]
MLINPAATLRIEHPGSVPVLIIDDFYADPEAVREQALAANYDMSVAQYPGRHATLTDASTYTVCETIARVATALGDRSYRAADFVSDFSIVTTRPQDLLATQKHPHVDPTPVLGLVYLTPGSNEGTCFYRNEMLGTATLVTPEQYEAYHQFMDQHAKSMAPPGYDFSDHPVWKKFHTIEPVFNRFVFYPGNVFHSIDIKKVDEQISMTRVRVTQRFIVMDTHPQ